LELNCAGDIEVGVAREVGRVVGICVMVGVGIGVIEELEGDWVTMGVLVAKEDTSMEMIVVWFGDWKPADAARDEGSLTVVAGGMIELVLLSVNLGIELVERLDREERALELVCVKIVVDELAVGLGDPEASLGVELELFRAAIVANDEVLVLVSEFIVAEPVRVTPSPVTCTSGFDEIASVPESPFVLAGEEVTDKLLEDSELLIVESEADGTCEASWEVEEVDVLKATLAVDDGSDVERLDPDAVEVGSVDNVRVGVLVSELVVGPTGIIVRTSGTEEELEISEAWVTFENGTALAKLLLSAYSRVWSWFTHCLRSSSLRSGPAALRTAKKSTLDMSWETLISSKVSMDDCGRRYYFDPLIWRGILEMTRGDSTFMTMSW
jgi:hypothetical protein